MRTTFGPVLMMTAILLAAPAILPLVVAADGEEGGVDNQAILTEARMMVGWPYDRRGVLLGRAAQDHPSHSWDYAEEGWHLEWGDDGKDNDGDGETDERDERFVVCTDLLAGPLERTSELLAGPPKD